MKRVICLAAILSLLCVTTAFAADAAAPAAPAAKGEVTSSIGSVQLYGIFKAGFNYYVGNQVLESTTTTKGSNTVTVLQPTQRPQDMEFTVNYANIGVKGWVVDERVTYNVSFNAYFKGSTLTYDKTTKVDTTTGDITYKTMTVSGSSTYVQLTDMVLGFHYIPYVGIYVGRILPAFTYNNSIGSDKYMFVEENLINANIVHRDRQTGLNLGLVTPYLDANLGAYNGRQFFPTYSGVWGYLPKDAASTVGNIDWVDQNTGKDIHFGVIGKPPLDGMKIRASLWYGMPLDAEKKNTNGSMVEHNVSVMFIDGDVDYLAPYGFKFVGEVLYGSYAWDKKDPGEDHQFSSDRVDPFGKTGADAYTLTTLSYNVAAGYNFGPLFNAPVELLVRYDWWDPDTLNNKKRHPYSINDQLTNITGAVNYYIKAYNAMIRIDYIHSMQQWKSYTAAASNLVGAPTYAIQMNNLAGTGTQTGIHNDALKLEAQVAF